MNKKITNKIITVHILDWTAITLIKKELINFTARFIYLEQ